VSIKREKELARAKAKRQSERRLVKAKRRNVVRWTLRALVTLALIGAIGSQIWPSDPTTAPAAQPTNSAGSTAQPTAQATDQPSVLAEGCVDPSPTRADNISFSEPGTGPASGTISLGTNCGVIEFKMSDATPKTNSAMSFLVENKFYDGVSCHRLTTSGLFVLQCGDPAGTGAGGPGYSFADENLPTADENGVALYPAGTVAMANAGPNTNGSQFFLVYKDTYLGPNYTPWGIITSGLDIIENIAAAGVAGGASDGAPATPVVITAATLNP
jgi:peptidyl-prolyl cis-trans isomerase B (cyclophilin B)